MTVIVFGSINMDLVVQTPHIPAPAETVTGHTFFTAPGGKGANQAVAAAKLGANTRMIGRVGNDLFAEDLLGSLQAAGVEITAVSRDKNHASGVALITVDDAAQNSIIVVPGANGQVGQAELIHLEQLLPEAAVLLLQLEIPLEMVKTAVSLAKQHSVTVILDPAPAQPLPATLYEHLDVITPNEIEAAQLVGFPVNSVEEAQRAAKELLARGVTCSIIKLGEKGLYFADATGPVGFVPPFRVNAIDSTAAGDAFNGGLAVALASGASFADAVRQGAAAGAIATTAAGAQSAMPTLAQLSGLLGAR